jgi:hypothetical protein
LIKRQFEKRENKEKANIFIAPKHRAVQTSKCATKTKISQGPVADPITSHQLWDPTRSLEEKTLVLDGELTPFLEKSSMGYSVAGESVTPF